MIDLKKSVETIYDSLVRFVKMYMQNDFLYVIIQMNKACEFLSNIIGIYEFISNNRSRSDN